MSKIFVTSDDHFWHRNIIKYCNRPWNHGLDSNGDMIITDQDIIDMNNALIENWNSVVNKDDIVVNLGDFCLGGKNNLSERCFEILRQLNGTKYLLLGNHDLYNPYFYRTVGFHDVYDKPILWDDQFMFSHRPLTSRSPEYKQMIDNAPFINIFGHVHNNLCDMVNGIPVPYTHISKSTYCCCVELTDYKPVLLSGIPEIIKEKLG